MTNIVPKHDQKLIDLFRSGTAGDRNQAYKLMIKKTRQKAVGWLINQKLDQNTAESLFYDGLMTLEKKVVDAQFELKSSIEAYFMGIVRFKWMEYNRSQNNHTVSLDEVDFKLQVDESNDDYEELLALLEKCLEKLKKECKQILYYRYYLKLNMKQIAGKMGFKGANAAYSAANKKNRCMKKLIIECNPNANK